MTESKQRQPFYPAVSVTDNKMTQFIRIRLIGVTESYFKAKFSTNFFSESNCRIYS